MSATRPAPSTPRDFEFPRFERAALPNGMRIIVAPIHRLPVVTAILVLDGGATSEAPGTEGVSDIVVRGLLEGSRDKTSDELVMSLERLGTSISASSDWESTILKMTVLSPNLGEAMSLMGEMVIQPRFDGEAIRRIRAERLSEIIQARSEPRVLADEMFSAKLYDSASRYSVPVAGTEMSVAALEVEHIREYHTRRYQPEFATLILAGDITSADATKFALRAFSDWQVKRANTESPVPVRQSTLTNRIHVIGRSGAQQSEIRMGHIGAVRSTPDYFPIVVMNAVLGGLFSSRINLNLREVHGYTYGASSYFDWRRDRGPFVVSSAVQSEVTGAAITEVLKEVKKIRNEKIGEDELTLATSYLAGVFPIRYETSDAVASGLASLVVFGLPDKYFSSYRENILSVTVAQVREAAEKYLQPDALDIVVVGNPALIEPQLQALGLGEVTVAAADS